MAKPTIEFYRNLMVGQVCTDHRPNTSLVEVDFTMYDHDGGWPVEGYAEKQWIYLECPRCRYQWSLAKLGFPRGDSPALEALHKEYLKNQKKALK